MNQLDKIQGALLGGAIGDSIGFIVEKKDIHSVQTFAQQLLTKGTYSIPYRSYPSNYLFGQYSDDTQLSKLLMLSHLNQTSFKDYLVRDYKANQLIGLGKNTRKILNYYSNNSATIDQSLIENISNGGLMRAGVIGLLYQDSNDIKLHSLNHSQLTHNTQISIDACTILAQLMSNIIHKYDIKDLLNTLPEELKNKINYGLGISPAQHQKEIENTSLLAKNWQGVPPLAQETLEASLISFFKYYNKSYKALICNTLMLGGDTDSTASIAGALWGAYNGLSKIDQEFYNIIHDNGQYNQSYFIELGNKVLNFRQNQINP